MTKRLNNNKGVALMITLAVLLVIVALASIILRTMLSQSRLTHHQVSRVQAYYAAMGVINYAYQQLILNNDPAYAGDPLWPRSDAAYTVKFCRIAGPGCQFLDFAFPASIQSIIVSIGAVDITTGLRRVSANADYTPTSPF